MKQPRTTILGFLAASLVPTAYLAMGHPLSGDHDVQSVVGSFFVYYFFAASATVILGVPIFIVLKKLKLVTWWSAVGSGTLVGIISLIAVTFGGSIDLAAVLKFGLLGGAAGFMFWIFWRAGST